MPPTYDTLSAAVEGLKKEGYTEDFNLKENSLESRAGGFEMTAADFEVDQVLRFEGKSNPADASVLYAISSEKNKVKGILVDAYGAYSGAISREMIEKLRYEPNE